MVFARLQPHTPVHSYIFPGQVARRIPGYRIGIAVYPTLENRQLFPVRSRRRSFHHEIAAVRRNQ